MLGKSAEAKEGDKDLAGHIMKLELQNKLRLEIPQSIPRTRYRCKMLRKESQSFEQ